MVKQVSLEALSAALLARPASPRTIVALAGAPGAGKSTMAERLVNALNAAAPGTAELLPMDGYHYDDGLLREMGRLAAKGAPDTFDVGGLGAMLGRLRANGEDAVCVPVFDRAIEIARAGARMIPREVSIVVVEGNYLLLRHPPWDSLRPHFDVTVMVETDEAVLRSRLIGRWEGMGLPAEEVTRKVETNDLPNGAIVRQSSAPADFGLRT